MSRKQINELKAGVILSYVNLGIGTIIPFLYTPVMLRILGQSEYGLYSLSNSVISYLSLLTLGLGGAILRYLTQYRTANDKEMLERVTGLFVTLYAVIAVVTCVVGFALTRFTGTFFAQGLTLTEVGKLNKLIVLMSLSTVISLSSGVYSSVSICYVKYLFRRFLEISATILSPAFNLVVLFLGYASVGMALVSLTIQLVTLLINDWYSVHILDIHPRFRNLPLGMLKDIFGFSIFVFIGTIADLLYWATDKVLLGAMIGSTAVAIYNIGNTFNTILQNMSSSISTVFAPRVNQYVFSPNRSIADLSELLIRIGRIQYLVVSLVLSGFIVFGQSFIVFWAGSDYREAYNVALLTMIPLAIPLIQNIAFTTITAQKRHQFRAILYTVLAVANVAGTYLLIPIMGLTGAAFCTCVVFVLGHGIIMNTFYYKKIGLDIPGFWKNIVKMTIVPCVLVLGFNYLQSRWLAINTVWIFLYMVIIYTMIFAVLSWLITMNAYEKKLFRDLLKKVIKARK